MQLSPLLWLAKSYSDLHFVQVSKKGLRLMRSAPVPEFANPSCVSGGGTSHARPGLWWDAPGLCSGCQNGSHKGRLWPDGGYSPHLCGRAGHTPVRSFQYSYRIQTPRCRDTENCCLRNYGFFATQNKIPVALFYHHCTLWQILSSARTGGLQFTSTVLWKAPHWDIME